MLPKLFLVKELIRGWRKNLMACLTKQKRLKKYDYWMYKFSTLNLYTNLTYTCSVEPKVVILLYNANRWIQVNCTFCHLVEECLTYIIFFCSSLYSADKRHFSLYICIYICLSTTFMKNIDKTVPINKDVSSKTWEDRCERKNTSQVIGPFFFGADIVILLHVPEGLSVLQYPIKSPHIGRLSTNQISGNWTSHSESCWGRRSK